MLDCNKDTFNKQIYAHLTEQEMNEDASPNCESSK